MGGTTDGPVQLGQASDERRRRGDGGRHHNQRINNVPSSSFMPVSGIQMRQLDRNIERDGKGEKKNKKLADQPYSPVE